MMNSTTEIARTQSAAFFQSIRNPVKFNLFLLQKLPAAYFSGLKLISANEDDCLVSVPYKWFTQNPFHSTYFACLSMAAEMSTGVLAMAHCHKKVPGLSMLVVGSEARFHKKATGLTIFKCIEGAVIRGVVEQSIHTGEGQTIRVPSVGTNKHGEVVAEFSFTWSFKSKGRMGCV